MKNRMLKLRQCGKQSVWVLFTMLLLLSVINGQDEEDDDFISPNRPTVSESAKIQKAGVLQVETGGDFDFAAPDFRNQQSAPFNLYFAASNRLRLDFEFESATSQKDQMGERETGIGDVNLGFKAIARDKPEKRLAVGFSYSIKLPTASDEKELGTGKIDHNLRLIFNRTLGKNDYIVNFSYLNVGREMSDKRDSGAQVDFTFERELPKDFGVITEFYGNTVDEEQPRGLYFLGALTYKINKRLQFDVGARPGFGRDAPRVGVFAGLTIGAAGFYHKR